MNKTPEEVLKELEELIKPLRAPEIKTGEIVEFKSKGEIKAVFLPKSEYKYSIYGPLGIEPPKHMPFINYYPVTTVINE